MIKLMNYVNQFIILYGKLPDCDQLNLSVAFQERLLKELHDLQNSLQEHNMTAAESHIWIYTIAGALDERFGFINCANSGKRPMLCETLFADTESGIRIFDHIEETIEKKSNTLDYLLVCYLLIKLGYRGKYYDAPQTEVNSLLLRIKDAYSEKTMPSNVHNNPCEPTLLAKMSEYSRVAYRAWCLSPFILLVLINLALAGSQMRFISSLKAAAWTHASVGRSASHGR